MTDLFNQHLPVLGANINIVLIVRQLTLSEYVAARLVAAQSFKLAVGELSSRKIKLIF